jgi:hypothetical protein
MRVGVETMQSTTQLAERAVLTAIIDNLAKYNYVPVAVFDGEDYYAARGIVPVNIKASDAIQRPLSIEECITVIYSVDDISTVHFADKDLMSVWGRRGVAVIPGNGRDFAHDWHEGIGGAFGAMVWEAIKDL